MTLFLFLTVIQALVAAALVGIVLVQRSEGGGLGTGGGNPGGVMGARGAADFLTRTTKWLAVAFVGLAIVLAGIAVEATSGRDLDDSLQRTAPAGAPADPLAPAPAPAVPADPLPADPLSDVAQ